eukprot:3418209-Rhodomonas_salina.1
MPTKEDNDPLEKGRLRVLRGRKLEEAGSTGERSLTNWMATWTSASVVLRSPRSDSAESPITAPCRSISNVRSSKTGCPNNT